MDQENLIEAVRKFSCLWDVFSKSYKDTRAKRMHGMEAVRYSYNLLVRENISLEMSSIG